MKKYILLFLLFPVALFGQDRSLFAKKIFVVGADTLPYRILLPKDYKPGKRYPLIVFLHGSGERGNDNEKQLSHGAELFVADSNREKYPAIVVFPQCPAAGFWSNTAFEKVDGKTNFRFRADSAASPAMVMLQKLIKKTFRDFKIQRTRVYVGGLSMGGMGTQEIIYRNPGMFAAAISICGAADTIIANKVSKTPLWLFHGAKDNAVAPHYSVDMAEALLKRNAKVKLTIYPNADHNSWDSAFAEPDLFNWLFSNTKKQ